MTEALTFKGDREFVVVPIGQPQIQGRKATWPVFAFLPGGASGVCELHVPHSTAKHMIKLLEDLGALDSVRWVITVKRRGRRYRVEPYARCGSFLQAKILRRVLKP